LSGRDQLKYCSNKCQGTSRYIKSVRDWKEGIKNGGVGIKTRIVSTFLRRYLFEKYDSRCSDCGWHKVHPITGKIPLEIDHIDGNAENNIEKNLRILCPNCHSLTPHFRNLNRGNGRKWRSNQNF